MSFATGGDGIYRNVIDWIEWGDQNNRVVLVDGADSKTVTQTRTIGTQTLEVTCTADGLEWHQPYQTGRNKVNTQQILKPPLVAYTPGSWAGDALDDLYNEGGAGHATTTNNPEFPKDFTNPNTMVIGLANPDVSGTANSNGIGGHVINKDGSHRTMDVADSNGANMSFNFTCAATLDGNPVPLEGLVFADAEASSSANTGNTNHYNGPEWVQASTTQDVTWRVIERARTCTQAYATASWPANGTAPGQANAPAGSTTLRLGVQGQECVYQNGFTWPRVDPNGYGPMSIAFMEGATSARVGLQGRGYSAVAVGYILAADFGDAPESYGEAGALFQQEWSGGDITPSISTTNVSSGFTLGTAHMPQHTLLGDLIDPEPGHQASLDALADDENGDDDEDALDGSSLNTRNGVFELPVEAFTDGTFTINKLRCHGPASGTATVAGWIDWNANGVFDAAERAEVSCASGQQNVSLTWAVPGDADPDVEYTFMRLRIAKDPAEVAQPTGISTTGEVEDHRLKLPARVKIDKTWIVDGVEYDHVEPDGLAVEWLDKGWLAAEPMLTPAPDKTALGWSQWQRDYRTRDAVSIGETGVFVDPINLPGCRLVSSTLTGDGIQGEIDLALGTQSGSVTLPKVHNEYEITNEVTCDPGEIVWEKVDETAEANALAGSEWKLTGLGDLADAGIELEITDCIADTTAECTGPDKDPVAGSFRITDLPWGSYELVETKAPPGFLLDSTVHEIEVGMGSSSTVTIDLGKIVNEQQDVPDIPLTGGLGSHLYLIGGGTALALVAALLVRRRWVLGASR